MLTGGERQDILLRLYNLLNLVQKVFLLKFIDIKNHVGIATRLWAGRSGVRIPVSVRDSLFSRKSRPAVELTRPLILLAPGLLSGD
jgi:hypothetical protein